MLTSTLKIKQVPEQGPGTAQKYSQVRCIAYLFIIFGQMHPELFT